MMKVMSFSRQGSRAICILSACGTISNVSLCQPTSCGGTLTYEVRSHNLFSRNNLICLSEFFEIVIKWHSLYSLSLLSLFTW